MNKREAGSNGETVAAGYLEQLGHTILARNWRGGRVELDIISRDLGGLHFVEVKSRTAPVMADPAVNVDATKQKHIVAAARKWLHASPQFSNLEIYFDIITVVFDRTTTNINYYPQAFIPIYV